MDAICGRIGTTRVFGWTAWQKHWVFKTFIGVDGTGRDGTLWSSRIRVLTQIDLLLVVFIVLRVLARSCLASMNLITRYESCISESRGNSKGK